MYLCVHARKEMQQTFGTFMVKCSVWSFCGCSTSVVVDHTCFLSTVCFKSEQPFCLPLCFLPGEAAELHQPVVLLCGSQPDMGHLFTSRLPPRFRPFALPAIISSLRPGPLLTLFFLIQASFSLWSVRNAVSGAYSMCHMNKCFSC